MSTDEINHPSHYTTGDIECIDAIREALVGEKDPFVASCRMQIIKYAWRCGKKGDEATRIKDLRKAVWYAETAANYLESK